MKGRTGRTVAEAAEVLGISPEAVRKRIARGTLEAKKLDGETWTVYLDDVPTDRTTDQTEDESHFWKLINDQKQEIERLRQELEREKARVDMLIERIPPQLPAPEQASTKKERVPWLQRLFGK
jgi:excisionase family DNA binding protein